MHFSRFLAVFTALSTGLSTLAYEITPATQLYYLDGSPVEVDGQVAMSPAGTTYGVFTGLATATNQLVLIEPTTPAIRDDIVTYDGVGELINDYIPAAGSVQRTASETLTDNGNGSFTLSILVTGTGELFPAGFVTGAGTPLTGAAFGVGLGLPAALGGGDPLTFPPAAGNRVVSATFSLLESGQPDQVFNLPVAMFFQNPNAWNGIVGITIANAVGQGFTGARLDITTEAIPEPASLMLLAAGAAAWLRQRR